MKIRRRSNLGLVLLVFNSILLTVLYSIGYIDHHNTYKIDLDVNDKFLAFKKYTYSLFQSTINDKLNDFISRDYEVLDQDTINMIQEPDFNFKSYYGTFSSNHKSSSNDMKHLELVSFHYRTNHTAFLNFKQKLLLPLVNLFQLNDPTKKINSLNKLYLNYLLNAFHYNREDSPVLTENYLQSIITLTSRQESILKSQHSAVVDGLSHFDYPNQYYKHNTNGIVIVGGDNYNWLTYLSVLNLREKGCTLPIEILIPNLKDYNLTYCERIYPQLNAKCLLMSEYLPSNLNLKINGYQYKSLALLLSSFENVLLMDSDNIILRDPTYMFESEVFEKNGLIIWPDYWKRTTSPFFYKISGTVTTDERVRDYLDPYLKFPQQPSVDEPEIPFHDLANTIPNPTSESGQLMFNKKTHFKTLLLSTYYNLFGPDFYYPLLTQGVAGEGDKETFISAAHVVNETYYQVQRAIHSIGYADNGYMNVVAMGQFDPVNDYLVRKELKMRLEHDLDIKDADDIRVWNVNSHQLKTINDQPNLLFIHANHPKLQPINLIKNKRNKNSKNERIRIFQNLPADKDSDFEINQWLFFKKMICDLKLSFKELGDFNRIETCVEIETHLHFLVDNPL